MNESKFLAGLLTQFPNVEENKIEFSSISSNGISFVKLCRLLSENGRVLETDSTSQSCIVAISAPPTSLNEGVAAVLLYGDTLYLAAYAREGLIKQHTAKKIIARLTKIMPNTELSEHKKKCPLILWVILGILIVICLCVISVFVLAIKPLQKAADNYNLAVQEYNSHADTYNSLVQKTSVDNLQGFSASVEKLEPVSTETSAIIYSFLNGNSAQKTEADIQTIHDLSNCLSDDIEILKQITAPSEFWVMNRLENVDDILSIQPVTPDNDPNGLLNKENGGYSACIYFTSTGIEVDGATPVDTGTDGGGAVEVYRSLEDAESRCEYLSGFDNTILYTGSYAIIGTMVIRISYIYTDEAQYEMTDRIAREFTRLETD